MSNSALLNSFQVASLSWSLIAKTVSLCGIESVTMSSMPRMYIPKYLSMSKHLRNLGSACRERRLPETRGRCIPRRTTRLALRRFWRWSHDLQESEVVWIATNNEHLAIQAVSPDERFLAIEV